MAFETPRLTEPTHQDFHRAIGRGANAWYSACLRITRNDALAQDAVQDALLSAWTKRADFRGTSRLETWIHRIAVNSALALLRRHKPLAWVEPEDMPGSEASLLEARIHQEIGRDLEVALEALSDMERVCFVLKHIEQWRLKEIAQHLGTQVGPVKQALFRALGKLRGALKHSPADLQEMS